MPGWNHPARLSCQPPTGDGHPLSTLWKFRGIALTPHPPPPQGHPCSLQGEGHLPLAPGSRRPAREAPRRKRHSPPAMVRPRTALVPAVTGLWSKVHSPWPEGGWVSCCLSQPPDWSLGLPGGRGGGGRVGAGDRTEGMVTLACVAWGGPGPAVLVRDRVRGACCGHRSSLF